ncbi:MAG: 2-amino-4-hydroxy-6-hydroxymethyldihydropteridine diphosphokinase [Cycloclasticus sp.]|jgi:2-amino-4-hydroxy-6-hydroxymethyldihydropteridine diphosphokinase|nr:2-amino-4-hydroxy-6-hydroxymethyldihydropteridine diphosphokinase [Cycloclasticus sp.]MEE4291991.1 2-amino-4-hydroxy-6-hydroxymethyldihydropteridine diphosphokinase [Cycloclasticus sp.]
MVAIAYIGLGSNLANPVQHILSAIDDIRAMENCSLKLISRLYETPPVGPQDQPNYINAAVKISTSLKPYELLATLQTIENQHGRTRETGRWGARTLDLDILLYDSIISNDPTLTLPHPELHNRAFVLYPLLDLDKDLEIPTLGKLQPLIKALNETPPRIIHSSII